MIRALLLAALVATPALAITPEQRLAALTKGRVAGKPVDCILPERIVQPEIIDGQAIVYRATGIVYVNRFKGGCAGIREGTRITTRSLSGQLCVNDQFRVSEPPGNIGDFCAFGPFTPYRKAK